MNRCPEKLLEFLGHGNLHAPCWFIGMEEGVDETAMPLEQSLEVRLRAFDRTMDLREAAMLLNSPITAERRPPTPTWPWMAKILRGLVGGESDWTDPGRARRFVVERLGTLDGVSFLAELLPLPKKDAGSWPATYRRWWSTREEYERAVLPERISLLRAQLRTCEPRCVIAYGKRHHPTFKQIFQGCSFTAAGRIMTGEWTEKTTVILTPFLGNGQFGVRDVQSILEAVS